MNVAEWPDQVVERFAAAQGPLNWPGLLDRLLAGYNRILAEGGMIVADRLDRVRCPTLIMHGDEDAVVPVTHAYELNRLIGGSELRIFHGAGHSLHRERHHELIEAVLSFLRRQHEAEVGDEDPPTGPPAREAPQVQTTRTPARRRGGRGGEAR